MLHARACSPRRERPRASSSTSTDAVYRGLTSTGQGMPSQRIRSTPNRPTSPKASASTRPSLSIRVWTSGADRPGADAADVGEGGAASTDPLPRDSCERRPCPTPRRHEESGQARSLDSQGHHRERQAADHPASHSRSGESPRCAIGAGRYPGFARIDPAGDESVHEPGRHILLTRCRRPSCS